MRILYINTSYDFSKGVNANRVFDLLDYFSKRKIGVTHLTPSEAFKIKGINSLVIPYSFTKKSSKYFDLLKSLYSFKDSKQNETWVNDIKNFVDKNPEKFRDFDLVYINTQPRCLMKLARYFKEKYGTKVAIDFHDPFYFDPYRPNLPIFNFLRKRVEEEYLRSVDLLIVNTPSTEKVYKATYPKLAVKCITNIYPQSLRKLVDLSVKNKDRITILYGGSLFVGRDLFLLLEAARKASIKVKIQVLGSFSSLNKLRYWKYPELVFKEKMSRDTYFKYLKGVDIGVVLQDFKVQNTGISCIAYKTYEYLAMNKPIIYIGPAGDNSDIIKNYSTNYCLVTKQNQTKGLIDYLDNFVYKNENVKQSFYEDFSSEKLFGLLTVYLKDLI